MRELGKIVAYVAATVLVGCFLAPPLYWAGRALYDAGHAPFLAKFAFPKYWNRAVLVAALALVVPFLRSMGIHRTSDLGLAPDPLRLRHFLTGLCVALAGALLLGLASMAFGRWQLMGHLRFAKLPFVAFTALFVALLEELFFRGALLGALRRTLSPRRALVTLSVVFAALHFVRAPKHLPTFDTVEWWSGFALVPGLFWQFGSIKLLLGGFVTLLLVGWVLGYAVLQTRSLYLGIGLHAGWVFALKSFDLLTRKKDASTVLFGRDLLTGIGPVILLACTSLVIVRLLQPTPSLVPESPRT